MLKIKIYLYLLILTFIPGRKHGSGTWFKKEHEKVASNLASTDKQMIYIVHPLSGACSGLPHAVILIDLNG